MSSKAQLQQVHPTTSPLLNTAVCKVEACGKRLNPNNKSGYCTRHRGIGRRMTPLDEQTSKSVIAKTSTKQLLSLYDKEKSSVSDIVDRLGPDLSPVEKQKVKKAIWGRLKKAGYKARPSGEAVTAALIGRPRPTLSLHTHPGELTVDKWKIVELKAAGKTNREIAQRLNRAQPTIYLSLRSMGFAAGAGVAPYYSWGELFDAAALNDIHAMSGLRVIDFARELGLSYDTLWQQLTGKRKLGQSLRTKTARSASEWRGRLFQYVMSCTGAHRRCITGGQARVIRTFFPNLR